MKTSGKTRLTLADIPELRRYVTVTQAAKMFGINKMSVYYKIYDQQKFDTVFRIGGNPEDPESDERPMLLLLRSEVESVIAAEKELAQQRATERTYKLAYRLNEWNKRVKQWGRDTGWNNGMPINVKGQPHQGLIDDYLAANPQDAKPV